MSLSFLRHVCHKESTFQNKTKWIISEQLQIDLLLLVEELRAHSVAAAERGGVIMYRSTGGRLVPEGGWRRTNCRTDGAVVAVAQNYFRQFTSSVRICSFLRER